MRMESLTEWVQPLQQKQYKPRDNSPSSALWPTGCDCLWSPHEHTHTLLMSQCLQLENFPTLKSPSHPVLTPKPCLLAPGSCVCLLTSRFDSCLRARVMFSWSLLLGCSGQRPEGTEGPVFLSRRSPAQVPQLWAAFCLLAVRGSAAWLLGAAGRRQSLWRM